MRELKFRTWNWLVRRYDETPCAFIAISGELTPSINRIVEQYTGLKDKNGKEIYEGDIVTLDNEWEEIDCSIISFKEGCFRVGEGYENEAGSYLSSWRVIGNIHENPELLEEE